jgi:RNA polymerase sigma factor (TIGR02999 family)
MMAPSDPPDHEITRLLAAWREGDKTAEEAFFNLVYRQLREIARRSLRQERQGHTLQTTALVNEVYLRLFKSHVDWQNRTHFFTVAAKMMRRVLVDYARSRQASKRSGGMRIEIADVMLISEDHLESVLAVDQALERLAEMDSRQAKIVEMHLFAGLSLEETAQMLQVSSRTVRRDWNFALAWLSAQILPPK